MRIVHNFKADTVSENSRSRHVPGRKGRAIALPILAEKLPQQEKYKTATNSEHAKQTLHAHPIRVSNCSIVRSSLLGRVSAVLDVSVMED